MMEYRPIKINGRGNAIIIWCSKPLFYKVDNQPIRIESTDETYELSQKGVQIYWGVIPEEEWGYLYDEEE